MPKCDLIRQAPESSSFEVAMTIEMETLDGGIAKVTLVGRLDEQGTEQIEAQLMDYAAAHRSVILDMHGVDLLTSMGIRVLLVLAKAVSRRGGKLALLNLDANVGKVVRLARLDEVIPVCESLQEARSAVSV
jgi:anti-anti-sigma factor